MLLNRKSVELLAPAGTWDALVAGVESGADAAALKAKSGPGFLGEQTKKLLSLAKQALPDPKNTNKRKK